MVSRRRRQLLTAGLGAGLAGCAMVEPLPVPPGLDAPAAPPPPGGVTPVPMLTPWLAITGGWRGQAVPVQGAPAIPQAGLPPRVTWQLPIGVAAQGDQVLVLDAGWRQLFRLERSRDALTPLGAYGAAVAADHAVSMQFSGDGGVWLAEPLARRVVLLDFAGRVRRELRDEALAARPVAVAVAPTGGDVFVADANEARIAVFNSFGRVHRRFGEDVLRSVSAMAFGPQGLVVLDRLAKQIVVFGIDGKPLGSYGDSSLKQPRAMAVDREGRVFVGDDGDQRIGIFADGAAVAIFGGAGKGPGRFGRIDAMAIDGAQLYVADSVNQRVQVMLVATESLRSKEAR